MEVTCFRVKATVEVPQLGRTLVDFDAGDMAGESHIGMTALKWCNQLFSGECTIINLEVAGSAWFTPQQIIKIVKLGGDLVDFHGNQFDLPPGYVAGWAEGVYYGIDEQGVASS